MKFTTGITEGGEIIKTSPAPGTKWRPMHRTPHGNNKTISIRRFIARDNEKKTK